MNITEPKYPNIKVRLVGEDGNAFSILGRCTRALKQNGHADQVEVFRSEATSGDYDNLLRTVMRWFDVDGDLDDEEDFEEHWFEQAKFIYGDED